MKVFGYLWCARSKQAQDDSLNSQGLAVDAYEKLASLPDPHLIRHNLKDKLSARIFIWQDIIMM